jgi:outer membrane immunogenic protein
VPECKPFTPAWGDNMSNPFTKARPPAQSSTLAACLVAATMTLACGSTATVAADMPAKESKKPKYQWSGCYAGLNLGGGASGTNYFATVNPGTHLTGGDPTLVGGSGDGGANADAFLAGGQAGCNLQSADVVVGLEGDFDYFHNTPNFANYTNLLSDGATPFTISQSLTTNWLATIRPRLGIAADRNLAYITGGVAFTRVSYTESYIDSLTAGSTSITASGAGIATASKSLVSWVAGGGWEYAFTDHWTARAEYLYASFPTTSAFGTITDPTGGANTFSGSTNLVVQIIRAGLNFKF